MAYTAGVAQPGIPFAGVGAKINSNVAGFQDMIDEEKLRQFHAALLAQQQQPQGYDAEGNALGPGMPGGPQSVTAPTLTQHYVKNAGLNYALNKLIKPPAQTPQGYDAAGKAISGAGGPGAEGGLGGGDYLGMLGHGNVGKWSALLKNA